MRKRSFYSDILIIAVICVIVVLLFNSCKVKKEILETHIETRDSVCNIAKSQNIILEHEDSVSVVSSIELAKVDTSKECVVKFSNIETKSADGSVSYDKSVIIYGKKNSIYVDIDKVTDKCSVAKDSASVSKDSVATTEQHVDSIDQNDRKSDKGWNTMHTLCFWILILILLCIGLLESERKR